MPTMLLTGAARENGIAAGIASRMRRDGWTVATSDITDADYPADLSDPDAPRALLSDVRRDHGDLDALVLSHAHDVLSGARDTTAESFDQHMAVNARASLLLIQEFAASVGPSGGAVVALTSDHVTGNLPYGVSKGALDRIVRSCARDYAPQGISANVLNPGPVDTGWMDDATRERLTALTPAGRLGTPGDIAALVAFLVSPEGRWVTGQLLHADGGFSAPH